jgi:hypothetical protein
VPVIVIAIKLDVISAWPSVGSRLEATNKSAGCIEYTDIDGPLAVDGVVNLRMPPEWIRLRTDRHSTCLTLRNGGSTTFPHFEQSIDRRVDPQPLITRRECYVH